MMQPPGSSGVQGLIYNKILPYLEKNGWEFHFAGPSPSLASVKTEIVNCPANRLHYTSKISWSRRFSVLKNRQSKHTLSFSFYAVLQLVATLLEKLVRHDSTAYLLSGISQVVRKAEAEWGYDLIAGKSPDFIILKAVSCLALELNKPLVAMVVDPHGRRDGQTFLPYAPEEQQSVLAQCCGAMFMSPMTLDRYVDAGLVRADKAYVITDSFPDSPDLYRSGLSQLQPSSDQSFRDQQASKLQLVHLGMLPEWRPIDALLQAVEKCDLSVSIDIFGYLYPTALKTIQSSSLLRSCIRCHKPVAYAESHLVAADCDVLLVVIGSRHLDNQPSKFFEYLGHNKPVFVVGPPGNPIEAIINSLGIGVYCDASDVGAIGQGLVRVASDYGKLVDSFYRSYRGIEQYSAKSVASHWSWCLDSMLNAAERAKLS